MWLNKYKEEQPIVYKTLTNTIKKEKYSHAYLFEKKGYKSALDVAISFAKLMLCSKDEQDCQDCTQCQMIDNNNYTELRIIEADGLWIKKEQLIDLQEEFSKKAITGNKKIYIINNADKLNTSSSNSILKFLEEPEENIIAILIVDNQYQLLKTIVSRCQIISFKKNKLNNEQTTLEKINNQISENIKFDEENLDHIIKFLDYYEQNGKETLLKTNKLWHQNFSKKEEITAAFEVMIFYYLDILNHLIKRNLKIFNDYEKNIKIVSEKNQIPEVLNKINIIIDLKDNIRYNMNSQLLIDKLILNLGRDDK